MDYENIQFFLWYTDYFHIEYIDFLSIHFFLLIILKCIITAVCVNHIDIIDNIIWRFQFLIEKIILPKRKKSTFSYF